MLSRLIYRWGVKSHLKDMKKFISFLEAMDSADIAIVLLVGTQIRHNILKLTSLDLLYPDVVNDQAPWIVVNLILELKNFQKNNDLFNASGIQIWIHTLRTVNSPELRKEGRKMWKELSRAFDKKEKAIALANSLLIKIDHTDGYSSFPDGLTPEPL